MLEPLRGIAAADRRVPAAPAAWPLACCSLGWLIAKAARFAVVKALRAFNFHVLTERAGIDGFLQQGGTEKDTTDLFGVIVYWLVILAALIVAFNGLGLTQVTDLLTRVLLFLPKLLVALVLLIFGSLLRAASSASAVHALLAAAPRSADAELLGTLVQYAIVAFVVLLVDRPPRHRRRPDPAHLPDPAVGGVVLALALAFGLGGRDRAAATARALVAARPADPRR